MSTHSTEFFIIFGNIQQFTSKINCSTQNDSNLITALRITSHTIIHLNAPSSTGKTSWITTRNPYSFCLIKFSIAFMSFSTSL